jgi:predicted nucleotide-binding protein (sugar kinase/HSP70/actin superfamily)
MIELLTSGTPNIICIQPFACLPNHVVGKGIVKKLKEKYPYANITAVDYDPGASEVNQLNRIKLMLSTAKSNVESKTNTKKTNNKSKPTKNKSSKPNTTKKTTKQTTTKPTNKQTSKK